MGDLKKRVDDFNSLRLPGQPFGMHMGTSYLVNDLWKEIQKRDNDLRKLVTDFSWIPDEYETETTAYKLWFELKRLLNDGGE